MINEHRSGSWSPSLSDAEKETLFAVVDDTIKWCVNRGRDQFSFDRYTITEKMKVPTATFVTLR